jgi:hypothetical protein
MSWFKRKPRAKTPPKYLAPRHSPISEKFLEEAKRTRPQPTNTDKPVGDK